MANADPLSAKAVQSVATQLSNFLPPPKATVLGMASAPLKQPAVAESLAVCYLTVQQVTKPPENLTVLVTASGMWCHQVRTANGATHMAMSQSHAFGSDELEVQQLGESPVAAKLDASLTWLDEHVPDDNITVRLLIAPAYFVHALAIIRPKKISVVLVDQPDGMTTLQSETEYPIKDFLKRLAKATPGMSLAE